MVQPITVTLRIASSRPVTLQDQARRDDRDRGDGQEEGELRSGVSIRPVSMRGMPDRPSFTSRQK
jgi:hypothetical protein